MKLKYLIAAFGIFLCNILFAQVKNPYSYYGVKSYDKQQIFTDSFNDNHNSWWTGDIKDNHYGYIKNGYYHYESKKANAKITYKYIKIEENKDYEIEASIKFLKGEKNTGNGLVWGYNSKNSYSYDYLFTSNGYYRLDKYVGKYEKYFEWKKSSLVKAKDYNILTIRKIGKKYYFFLNKTYVYSMPYEYFFGQRIGFQVTSFSAIKIDYLKVSYIKKKEVKNYPPQITITEPAEVRNLSVGKMQKKLNNIITSEKYLKVAGTVTDDGGVFEVKVNGIDAYLQANGSFYAQVPLIIGQNTVRVIAKDDKMLSSRKTFKITRKSKPLKQNDRLALIIGNAEYTHGGKLLNPVNDANSISKVLKDLGFEVMVYENASQTQMKRAIDLFGRKLKNYKVGLFFYAGHGLQVDGSNYLVPINANLQSKNDVEYDCVQAGRILAKMEAAGSKTNIIILDACRNNPFERSWTRNTKGGGLAFMNAPAGSLIAYATSPGKTASDGRGSNGLYTSSLLKHIKTSNISVLEMFQRVRNSVMENSESKQTPWESTSLRGNFYFKK